MDTIMYLVIVSDNFPEGQHNMSKQDTMSGDDLMQQLAFTGFDMQQMTLGEYEQRKKQRLEDIMSKKKRDYFVMFRKKLMAEPHNYGIKVATDFAKDLLDPESNISYNIDPLNEEEDMDFDQSELGRLRQQWLATVDEQLLLLRFPVPPSMQSVHARVRLELEQDDISRQMQNETFVQLYSADTVAHHQRIEHLDEFTHHLNYFLHTTCRETNLATIIFNGHGSSHGLSIHRSRSVPLNHIVAMIQASVDNIQRNPRAIDIVFAQCFGHEHSHTEDPLSRVNVISLTFSRKRKTTQNVKCDGTGTVTESCNYDMEDYASKRRRVVESQEDTVDVEGTTDEEPVSLASSGFNSLSGLEAMEHSRENNSAPMHGSSIEEDPTPMASSDFHSRPMHEPMEQSSLRPQTLAHGSSVEEEPASMASSGYRSMSMSSTQESLSDVPTLDLPQSTSTPTPQQRPLTARDTDNTASVPSHYASASVDTPGSMSYNASPSNPVAESQDYPAIASTSTDISPEGSVSPAQRPPSLSLPITSLARGLPLGSLSSINQHPMGLGGISSSNRHARGLGGLLSTSRISVPLTRLSPNNYHSPISSPHSMLSAPIALAASASIPQSLLQFFTEGTAAAISPIQVPTSPVTHVPYRITESGDAASSPFLPPAPDVLDNQLFSNERAPLETVMDNLGMLKKNPESESQGSE